MATAARDERLQLRVDAGTKRQLEEAAGEAGMNLSTFVLLAARQRASEVLAERSVVRLDPGAAAAFSEALARPAEVNARLAQALARPTKIEWLD